MEGAGAVRLVQVGSFVPPVAVQRAKPLPQNPPFGAPVFAGFCRIELLLYFFFGGVGDTPLADGFDAFCFAGASFLGFLASLPFGIFNSFNGARVVNLTAKRR